jgi:hypothetical protein
MGTPEVEFPKLFNLTRTEMDLRWLPADAMILVFCFGPVEWLQ